MTKILMVFDLIKIFEPVLILSPEENTKKKLFFFNDLIRCKTLPDRTQLRNIRTSTQIKVVIQFDFVFVLKKRYTPFGIFISN